VLFKDIKAERDYFLSIVIEICWWWKKKYPIPKSLWLWIMDKFV